MPPHDRGDNVSAGRAERREECAAACGLRNAGAGSGPRGAEAIARVMDPERVVIDTERVIEEVRARPQIWDPVHELYKSREARQAAWTAVTGAIVCELHDLSRPDQHEIEKKIQQRWRTARDCFVKARAQLLGGGGGTDKSYGYYDAMTFLEPTLRLPFKVQKGITAHLHAAPTPAPPPAAAVAAGRRKRARLGNGASAGAGAVASAGTCAGVSADLSPLERKLVSMVASRAGPLDEDDDNFFKSLAPLLRTLHTHQKLAFRSRVLALALEVQSGALQHPFLEVALRSPGSGPSAPDSEDDALETKYRPPPPALPSDEHSDC